MEEEADLFCAEIDDGEEEEQGEDLPGCIPAGTDGRSREEGPAISDPEDRSGLEPDDGPDCSCCDRRQPEEKARDWPTRARSLRVRRCCYRSQEQDTPEYPEDTDVAASAAGAGLLGSTVAAAVAAPVVVAGIRTVLPEVEEDTAEGDVGRTAELRRTALPAAAWAASGESEGSTREGNRRSGALQ